MVSAVVTLLLMNVIVVVTNVLVNHTVLAIVGVLY